MTKTKYIISYSFGGQLVYAKTFDGGERTSDRNRAYQFDAKEAQKVLQTLIESGYGSAEVEEV